MIMRTRRLDHGSTAEALAMPRVGIALAVYRPTLADFREQLLSIRNQSYANWFCVLTLDSPLPQPAEEIAEFLADPRFEWHQNPRRLGFKENFSQAIQMAVAKGARFVACADQDDVWYPDKLATLVTELLKRPPLSLVHADMDILRDGQILGESAWDVEQRSVRNATPWRLLVRNIATGASMLMDAELARRYPVVPDEIRFHDYWYALVASFHGGVHAVDQRLHAYRQHRENVVGVNAYRGFLNGEHLTTLWRSRHVAVQNFRTIRSVARRAVELGLPLTPLQKLVFSRTTDAGLGLLMLGLVSLRSDPPLAANCLALCAGKLLDLLGADERVAI
jgi:hypothetical protein